jgi:sucrose synthase
MINDTLNTIPKLQKALKIAEAYVSAHHKDTPYQKFENRSISNSFFMALFW